MRTILVLALSALPLAASAKTLTPRLRSRSPHGASALRVPASVLRAAPRPLQRLEAELEPLEALELDAPSPREVVLERRMQAIARNFEVRQNTPLPELAEAPIAAPPPAALAPAEARAPRPAPIVARASSKRQGERRPSSRTDWVPWLAVPLLLFSTAALALGGYHERDIIVTLIPWAGALIAGVSLWFGISAGRAYRLYGDLPTSKTTGVFMGLVELKGQAETERPVTSYLAGKKTVYYEWEVLEQYKQETKYTDKDGKAHTITTYPWTQVDSGGEAPPFYLKDDAGSIRVLPNGADVDATTIFDRTVGTSDPLYYGKGPRRSVANSIHNRNFVERAIVPHEKIYVVGPARERKDVVAPEIAADKHIEDYLISTRSEEEVRSGLRWKFWGLGVTGALFSPAGFMLAEHMANWRSTWDSLLRLPEAQLAAGAFLGLWLLGYVVMAFNSLISLRNRVSQAWANIDVQLKRRADLIPNLAKTVEGLRAHEKETQELLAVLRSQAVATAPGKAGPNPRALKARFLALAESYPKLKSQEAFLKLQRELADTEERIALARGYYNEIATAYNTRLQTLPDGLIARLGGMRPRPPLTADGFERAAVEVRLSE